MAMAALSLLTLDSTMTAMLSIWRGASLLPAELLWLWKLPQTILSQVVHYHEGYQCPEWACFSLTPGAQIFALEGFCCNVASLAEPHELLRCR